MFLKLPLDGSFQKLAHELLNHAIHHPDSSLYLFLQQLSAWYKSA